MKLDKCDFCGKEDKTSEFNFFVKVIIGSDSYDACIKCGDDIRKKVKAITSEARIMLARKSMMKKAKNKHG